MRIRQLDKITKIEPGKHLEAVRQLSASEWYLNDHFPQFPVMPGVLMLEAMFQAAQWLVRKTDDFRHAAVVLNEARNVKFSGFVKPGQTLAVTADIKKQDGNRATLMTRGAVDGNVVVSGRLKVETFRLADRYPPRAPSEAYIVGKMKQKYERLMAGEEDPSPRAGMRWMWIDRMIEFVRGERAVAIKNVNLTEDPVDEYPPAMPTLPCSLIVEGLALTGGILANDERKFAERIVLAKVNKAVFHRPALPGDQLRYTAELERSMSDGAFIHATSHVGDELQAEVDLFLAFLGDRITDHDLIVPEEVLLMLRLFGLYDVGKNPDGTPIDVPERLLKAEHAAYGDPPA